MDASRLGALCLAIVYLLLQLGGTWHLAQRGHALCAEHGEWIDLAHEASANARTAHPGPTVDRAASSQEHDHCLVVEASRIRVVVEHFAPVEPLHERIVAIAPTLAEDPLDVGFDRYLLAPKQSPPC